MGQQRPEGISKKEHQRREQASLLQRELRKSYLIVSAVFVVIWVWILIASSTG